MLIDLYPHQQKAIKELKNGSILRAGVGTGKTITSIAYFYTRVANGDLRVDGEEFRAPRTPKDIYVLTTAKKRDSGDWEKEAAAFSITTDRSCSIGGIKIKVDSWNNIGNYVNVKDAFFIFDEQRLVGKGSWVKAFLHIAMKNEWIMLSATPGDNWMDYVPIFLAHGFYKNRTEFLREHVVYNNFSRFPKVDRYVEQGKLNKLRRQITVEMPYDKHTTRHVHNVIVDYDKELFDRVTKDRWHVYEERPLKDVGEMFIVMRKAVNSDPSRIEAIKTLMRKHPRLIIFYNFNYELEALRELSGVFEFGTHEVAEWNGSKHQPVPTSDKWIYLVQYTAGAEGWNCISTDATAFYSLNYSYKINEQSKGRIERLNTPYKDLHYYILRSPAMIDQLILKSLHQKKSFNEKDVAKKFGTFDYSLKPPVDEVDPLEHKYNKLPQAA